MPIYRKKGKSLDKLKDGARVARKVFSLEGGKRVARRVLVADVRYSIENTSYRSVLREFRKNGFDLERSITESVSRHGQGVVVDWGCGQGNALRRIAAKFKDKVRLFGISDLSYKEWKKPGSITFIHEDEHHSLRYIKDSSTDLIFSHVGLDHLKIPFGPYMKRLLRKLRNKGILLTTVSSTRQAEPFFGAYFHPGSVSRFEDNGRWYEARLAKSALKITRLV